MKGPSMTALAFAGVAAAGVLLALLGGPQARRPDPPAARPPAPIASVNGGGFTMASAEIALPEDAEALPAGPNVDLVAAKCGACHSPGMLITQPVLKPEQWAATVKKMREVYKAPVSEAEVPAILAYLNALSAQKASPAAAPAAAAAAP